MDTQFFTEATNSSGIISPIGGANSALVVAETAFEATTWLRLTGRRTSDPTRLELAVNGLPASDYDPEMVEQLLLLKEKGPVAKFKGAAQVLERFSLKRK
jgi:hypothetical protein